MDFTNQVRWIIKVRIKLSFHFFVKKRKNISKIEYIGKSQDTTKLKRKTCIYLFFWFYYAQNSKQVSALPFLPLFKHLSPLSNHTQQSINLSPFLFLSLKKKLLSERHMSQRPQVPHSSSIAFGLHSHLLISSEISSNSNWSL